MVLLFQFLFQSCPANDHRSRGGLFQHRLGLSFPCRDWNGVGRLDRIRRRPAMVHHTTEASRLHHPNHRCLGVQHWPRSARGSCFN
jgi:hypothetical protein